MSRLNTFRTKKPFEYGEHMGAYADISFEITSEAELGTESIRFDTQIHYVDEGEGIPLLLVHGIGQSLFTWRHSIPYYASRGYRVIAPDLAGCGYSGHPNIYYTVEEQALVLRALLETLDIGQVHIAAFSTGCLSALCLAAEAPEMVSALVLVSPGGPNERYPFGLRALTSWTGRKLFPLFINEGSIRNLLHDMYFDATKLTDDVVSGYLQPMRSHDVRETFVMSLMQFDDDYVRSVLKGVQQPVLIFSGCDDRIHPDEMIRAYAVTIPGAHQIRMRNCGHFVHEEKHAKFNTEALAFFRDPAHLGYGRTRSM